jgi:hypothetical protein
MKRLLSIFFVCSLALQLLAAVDFKASAPTEVEAGTPFRITYSINQPAKDLKAPDFANF